VISTLRQVASTIGKLIEVDWHSLFASFFAMVRIKVKSRDPTAVPTQRMVEMNDELFVINFKTQGVEQMPEKSYEDGGNDEDPHPQENEGDA